MLGAHRPCVLQDRVLCCGWSWLVLGTEFFDALREAGPPHIYSVSLRSNALVRFSGSPTMCRSWSFLVLVGHRNAFSHSRREEGPQDMGS